MTPKLYDEHPRPFHRSPPPPPPPGCSVPTLHRSALLIVSHTFTLILEDPRAEGRGRAALPSLPAPSPPPSFSARTSFPLVPRSAPGSLLSSPTPVHFCHTELMTFSHDCDSCQSEQSFRIETHLCVKWNSKQNVGGKQKPVTRFPQRGTYVEGIHSITPIERTKLMQQNEGRVRGVYSSASSCR